MKKILLAVLIVAAVLAALYFAFRTPEGPIVLAYKFKVGDTSDYRVTARVRADLPTRTSAYRDAARGNVRRKVLKVNKDGSASILIFCPESSGDSNLVPGILLDGIKLTASRAGHFGQSKELAKRMVECSLLSHLSTVLVGYTKVLPERGVGVGQTWNVEVPFPPGGGNVEVNSTLVSDHCRVGGRWLCRIESRYCGSIDFGKVYKNAATRRMGYSEMSGKLEISGECTLYFSREEGRIIQQDDTARMDSTVILGKAPGAGGSSTSASITYHITADADYRAVLVEKKSKRGS